MGGRLGRPNKAFLQTEDLNTDEFFPGFRGFFGGEAAGSQDS